MYKSTCSFEGCVNTEHARKLCSAHYRQRRRGQELRPIHSRMSLEDRFWAKVNKTANCWEWIAQLDAHGYGRISVNDRSTLAHRVSWEFTNGLIPEGMVIDHRCGNRACVKPAHLRVVTVSENNQHFTGTPKDNTSGVRGVVWHKSRSAWMVQVGFNGRNYYGGLHSTLEAADKAARALRAQLHTHDDHHEWVRQQ